MGIPKSKFVCSALTRRGLSTQFRWRSFFAQGNDARGPCVYIHCVHCTQTWHTLHSEANRHVWQSPKAHVSFLPRILYILEGWPMPTYSKVVQHIQYHCCCGSRSVSADVEVIGLEEFWIRIRNAIRQIRNFFRCLFWGLGPETNLDPDMDLEFGMTGKTSGSGYRINHSGSTILLF